MRLARLLLACAFAEGILACDPIFTTHYRQALTPAPAVGCVASALKTAPNVARVKPESTARSQAVAARFRIVVQDTTIPPDVRDATVERTVEPRDFIAVTLSYGYVGTDRRATALRAQEDSLMRSILERVRRTCAPESPRKIECKSTGFLGGDKAACHF